MSASFSFDRDCPLGKLGRAVMGQLADPNWPDLYALLNGSYPGSKSGLHALREGLTALAKRAQQEHDAMRREQGWKPWAELLGDLVAEHGAPAEQHDRGSQRCVIWRDLPRVGGKPAHVIADLDGEWARIRSAKLPGTAPATREREGEPDVRALGREVLDRINRLWPAGVDSQGKRERAVAELSRLGTAGDVRGLEAMRDELQERLESLGSNSEGA